MSHTVYQVAIEMNYQLCQVSTKKLAFRFS